MSSVYDLGRSFSEGKDNNEENCLLALQLASATVFPMVLKAALELDVLEIISRAGPSAYLSTSDIASQLPTQNPDAPAILDRILRLLAVHSVIKSSVVERDDNQVQMVYGLAPVCKFLTGNQDDISLRPYLLLLQDKTFMDSWQCLKDAVLEGGVPFIKAHGMHVFEYTGVDARFNKVVNKAMSNITTMTMVKILETYKGFEGLKVVVDVGGGIGVTINMITAEYPQIKGINFDLPHVIADAPSYPGVEHLGGDMFEYVPNADAIFMKCILHDWNDEDCLKLLKNCWKALPNLGKVIALESILPETLEATDPVSKVVWEQDLLMLSQSPGGKERTYKQFQDLALSSGFTSFQVVCSAYHSCVLEFQK
ncbi:PREDICTED: caffeic acid 3-O-methyltransferase-like [Nelumbo nucifera]|uniref:Caffeic acid 3-O-methyltransferase-like n=1 Tax=Nelumbo nucifera TaxID=4432 RepID=A0A1U7ZW26_NELNU|nr:PREDICTED: caffeic acid 3-O-methyltransferase-like [Nelumbo nucifera]